MKFYGDHYMSCFASLEVLTDADVVVCGGGPAGLGASIAAARNGAKVVLLEQTGALGGMASVGLVPSVIHMTDGKNITAAGVCTDILAEVCKRMNLPKINYGWQNVNAEIFKQVCDEKAAEAGVKVYFNQKLAAVEREGAYVKSVVVAGSKGLKKVTGKVFVDSTGDGALSAFAGADFEVGDKDGNTMSPSLCVQYAPVDWDEYAKGAQEGKSDRALWKKMLDNGTAPLLEHHFVGTFKCGERMATGNLGHIYGTNCLNEDDITRGYTEGRKIAVIIHKFFKEQVPGFQNSELVNTASLLSVRETRRIVGDYKLCYEDYLKRSHFEDDIARFSYPIDIHSSKVNADEQKRVEERLHETRYKDGENYGIPYRAILPKGLENVYITGRSVSCDREIQSSLRVMPGCFVTGQAAGSAAAMSLASGGRTRSVDVAKLRANMREKLGAFLP